MQSTLKYITPVVIRISGSFMYGDSLLFKNFLFNKKLRNPFNTIQIMTAIIVPEIIPAKISPG